MKKFLALLFALLMPFCFLFGCAGDNLGTTKTGLPYKNGILEYDYIVESHSRLLAVVTFRISIIEKPSETTKLVVNFYYYDEDNKNEKLLYREVDQNYFYIWYYEPLQLYKREFYIPNDTFTNGKTISSAVLELVEI